MLCEHALREEPETQLRASNDNAGILPSLQRILSTYYVPLCSMYKRQKDKKA